MKFSLACTVDLPMNYLVPMHSHDEVELMYFINGNGHSRINGVTYAFSPGVCLLAKAGVLHDQHNLSPVTTICLTFSDERFSEMPVCIQDALGQIGPLCRRILHESEARLPGYEEICEGLLLEIAGLLHRYTAENAAPVAHPMVRSALEIIRQCHGCITPGELAERLYVSPDYLRHLMREHTDRSPIRHVMEQRLQHACALLCHTSLSIGEISRQCGFDDTAYFSRLFKKHFGQSPKRFRADSV